MKIIDILESHEEEIKRKYPVRKIGVFGSFARGDQSPTSDVDVLVEFSEPVDLFEFIDLKHYLEKLLGREVDLVTVKALKPQLKERILNEVVYV
jgi:predicted nucleotidyltransferase